MIKISNMLVYALIMHMNTEAKLIFAFFYFPLFKNIHFIHFFHCEPYLKWYNKILYDYIFLRRESYTYVHFIKR